MFYMAQRWNSANQARMGTLMDALEGEADKDIAAFAASEAAQEAEEDEE